MISGMNDFQSRTEIGFIVFISGYAFCLHMADQDCYRNCIILNTLHFLVLTVFSKQPSFGNSLDWPCVNRGHITALKVMWLPIQLSLCKGCLT